MQHIAESPAGEANILWCAASAARGACGEARIAGLADVMRLSLQAESPAVRASARALAQTFGATALGGPPALASGGGAEVGAG